VARLPHAYVLSIDSQEAAAQHALLATPPGLAEVRTVTEPGERPGTWRVTVVAADRPGLLARIAGSLALGGLSILSAQAFTTSDGTAIDLFDVTPAFEGDVDEERWRSFRHTLRRALDGRISLEYRVRERRRQYRGTGEAVATEVRVLHDASGSATVVEVETADRIGLLYDLARTFEELHLDVSLAEVATYGPRVVDAFYVTVEGGGKVDDAELERELERAVRARLED
jgi:[protein-PII] uridylyltransferase